MNVLFINGKRNGYGVDQCGKTLTVRELIEELEGYDGALPVYLNNDNGYTFGNIILSDIYEDEADDE